MIEQQRDKILQAIARGWCAEPNTHKEIDPDLANAFADEVMKALPDHTDLIRRMVERVRHSKVCGIMGGYSRCTCGASSLIAEANKIQEAP